MKVNCYPNPALSTINIDIINSVGQTDVVLFNLHGQELISMQLRNNKASIDLSKYSDGLYFLKISSGNKYHIEKIIKK